MRITHFYPPGHKKNKYKAIKTKCLSGHEHPSRLEANFCDILAGQVQSGVVKSFEIQKPFPMFVNGEKICTHYVDFLVKYPDGMIVAMETKGVETGVWRLKKKLFEALYPGIHYEVVR